MATPLFLSAVVYMLSLLGSGFFDPGPVVCLLLILVGAALFFGTFLLKKLPWYVCILGLVFALGFSYGEWRESLAPANPFTAGESVAVTGEVVNDPVDTGTGLKCTFLVTSLAGENLGKPLRVIVIAPRESAIRYGDELSVSGSFLTSKVANPGAFDYDDYLAQKGIYGVLSALYDGSVKVESQDKGHAIMVFSYWLKHRFESALSYLPPDQAAVIDGIFFGDTNDIDQTTSDVLMKSGIYHCFSVSGLHVGYIVLFLTMICRFLGWGRLRKLLLIAVCLFFYSAMTGFSAPVLRAAIMCLMIYGADLFGREKNAYNGLAAAALLILICEPLILFQASFQLSFLAMFSLLFVTPWLERFVKRDFPGKQALLATVAAQIGMTPLLAYDFHIISIVTLLVSTVSCLIVGGMVVLCFAALLFAALVPILGAVFLIPCGLLGTLIVEGVTVATQLPLAYLFKGDFSIWILLLMYALIFVVIAVPWCRHHKNWCGLVLAAAFVLFLLPVQMNRDELTVTFLSVGEGDAIYIHTPGGDDIMVDACDKINGSVSLYTIRPFLLSRGVNRIDYMILSHDDIDHSGGVPYLDGFFGISSYVLSTAGAESFDEISALAGADHTFIDWVKTGDRIDLGGGVELEILYPDAGAEGEANDLSMVARLSYGDFSVLFTGDIGAAGIDALLSSGEDLDADILKIPHHGSEYSYDEEFYASVDPDAFVISVGKNHYGHPDAEVISYAGANRIACYRTDEDGSVTVSSDGSGYEITTFADGRE